MFQEHAIAELFKSCFGGRISFEVVPPGEELDARIVRGRGRALTGCRISPILTRRQAHHGAVLVFHYENGSVVGYRESNGSAFRARAFLLVPARDYFFVRGETI